MYFLAFRGRLFRNYERREVKTLDLPLKITAKGTPTRRDKTTK